MCTLNLNLIYSLDDVVLTPLTSHHSISIHETIEKLHTLQASKKLASLFQQQNNNNNAAAIHKHDLTAAAKNKVAEEDVPTDVGTGGSAFSFNFNI